MTKTSNLLLCLALIATFAHASKFLSETPISVKEDLQAVEFFEAFMGEFNVTLGAQTLSRVNAQTIQLSNLNKALDYFGDSLIYPEKQALAIDSVRSVFESQLKLINPSEASAIEAYNKIFSIFKD